MTTVAVSPKDLWGHLPEATDRRSVGIGQSLIQKIRVADSGCWEWTAARGRGGYGLVRFNGAQRPAHRVAYETAVGPIPDGLQLDHLCRNTCCVNPAHLEPVTGRENTMRGTSFSAINAAKTHCIRGHAFADHGWTYRGRRYCRECRRQWKASARARKNGATS